MRDVGRQDRVEAAQQAVRRDGQLQIEAGDLAVGVHAGVGATGAADEHRLAGHVADGVFDRRLDGPLPYLSLPAREVGAVVLDGDAPPAAQNWNMMPSDQLASPTCSRFDMPRPEMSA